MEPLLILAAFSFNLYCQPVQPSVHELDFSSASQCSQAENTKASLAKPAEKIQLVGSNPAQTTKNLSAQKMALLASRFSPSISLNRVSWINSSLTEQYDPRLSVRIRRAELSGFEALVQVSIPL